MYLHIGEPDYDTPPHIVRAGQEALAGRWTHYTSDRGLPELRQLLAQKIRKESHVEYAFEDEIRSIVTEGLYDGVLEEEEREMIEGVIELGDTDVSDIMTPRSNVDSFDAGLEWEQVLSLVIKVGRTRIPVHEGSLDNIVGILYVKDLLRELSTPREVRKSIRELRMGRTASS